MLLDLNVLSLDALKDLIRRPVLCSECSEIAQTERKYSRRLAKSTPFHNNREISVMKYPVHTIGVSRGLATSGSAEFVSDKYAVHAIPIVLTNGCRSQ